MPPRNQGATPDHKPSGTAPDLSHAALSPLPQRAARAKLLQFLGDICEATALLYRRLLKFPLIPEDQAEKGLNKIFGSAFDQAARHNPYIDAEGIPFWESPLNTISDRLAKAKWGLLEKLTQTYGLREKGGLQLTKKDQRLDLTPIVDQAQRILAEAGAPVGKIEFRAFGVMLHLADSTYESVAAKKEFTNAFHLKNTIVSLVKESSPASVEHEYRHNLLDPLELPQTSKFLAKFKAAVRSALAGQEEGRCYLLALKPPALLELLQEELLCTLPDALSRGFRPTNEGEGRLLGLLLPQQTDWGTVNSDRRDLLRHLRLAAQACQADSPLAAHLLKLRLDYEQRSQLALQQVHTAAEVARRLGRKASDLIWAAILVLKPTRYHHLLPLLESRYGQEPVTQARRQHYQSELVRYPLHRLAKELGHELDLVPRLVAELSSADRAELAKRLKEYYPPPDLTLEQARHIRRLATQVANALGRNDLIRRAHRQVYDPIFSKPVFAQADSTAPQPQPSLEPYEIYLRNKLFRPPPDPPLSGT